MPFVPEFENEFPTLGWGVLDFITEMLAQPDQTEYRPLMLTPEQARFVLNYYRLDPVTGRRVYRRAVWSRPKGSGKSPMMGAIGCAEALADVVFDGWDANGRPVGKPWSEVRTPLVQFAAMNEDQTRNAFDPLLEMLREGPAMDYYDIDPMDTFVALPKGRIEYITAAGDSKEGNRPVWAALDQALALDTPIPTPSGWTTMGDLKTGDIIYGSSGIVRVSEAKPVSLEHDCYRITFQDGTSVVASAGHLWMSRKSSWPAKYRDRVRTTEDMLDSGRYRIPLAPIQERPEIELPADPYLLGLWLGDGTRGKCEISVGAKDVEEVEAILNARGIWTNARNYARGDGRDACWNVSFSYVAGQAGSGRPVHAKEISKLDCFLDKHVPEVFFEGSASQRLDLLRGLMDSDGCATAQGVCTFVNTNKALADAVTRLVRSLGQVTSGVKRIVDSRYSGGVKYRVDFSPRRGIVPFLLERKRRRVKNNPDEWVNVVSIEKVERVPVRCIAVDSEDHLFAFGESGHLTHNTEGWTKSNGGVKLAGVLRRNAGKVGGTTIETPNAYRPGMGSVSEQTAAYHQSLKEGRARQAGLLYDHREAPADTDMTDRASLRDGLVYAYGDSAKDAGGWVDLDRIVEEIWDPATDPQDARQYYLNQVTHASDSWVSRPEIVACMDVEQVVEPGETIVLGFDGSRGRVRGKADATALVGMTLAGKHLFEIAVWERRDHDPQDWSPDPAVVDAVVRDTFSKYQVVGFYADPSGWTGQVAQWEADYGRQLRVRASRDEPIAAWPRGKDSKVAEHVERLRLALVQREISWDGSSALMRHMLNARRRVLRRGGYLLYKQFPDSPDKIDAAYAAVMAYKACLDATSRGVTRQRGERRKVVLA